MTRIPLAAVLIGLATASVAQAPTAPAAAPAAAADGISFDTWAVRARERLMALDTNHDGKLSKEEFAARGGMMGPPPGGPGAPPPPPPPPGADGAPGAPGGRMFDRLDANQDGFLDGQEINGLLARRFARMDANHDGVLTADERQAMRGMAPGQ